MKRLLAAVLFVLGFAAAGSFAAAVVAETTTTTTTASSSTTSTSSTTTGISTSTTTTTPLGTTIPAGVSVAGVHVGGLASADAATAVQAAFDRPLNIVVNRSRLVLDPADFARPYVAGAIARARRAAPGAEISLVVTVRGAGVRTWVQKVVQRFDREPVDATLALERGRPHLTPDRVGQELNGAGLIRRIVAVLRANTRPTLRVHTTPVRAKVVASSFGPVILINRSINRLFLYQSTARRLKAWRTFAVATGQAIYPTPRGTFHIIVKWKDPWWYPPVQDDWAKGLQPVPPGPNNPLGTRWMGLSAPGIGIHGTDAPASIGYSASHGCIRMQVPDAEWLFDHVDIGTTVFIV